MAQKVIKTSIEIAASPEVIWKVLTDFSQYKNWNPFITSAEVVLRLGKHLKITAGGMSFKPEVLTVKKNKELCWKRKLLFNGIFDGEHSFEIVDHKNGTCTFKQGEIFTRVLVGLFSGKLDRQTKPGFEGMNEGVKELSEK